MFGIAWGIVSMTLMVGAGEGLRQGQEKVARNFGKNIMIVFAGRTSMQAGGARAGRRIRWQVNDYGQVQAESPSCEYVIPEYGRNAPIRSLHNSANLLVTGSLPPFSDIRTIEIGEGRFYNDEDVAQGRRVVVLGSDARKQLFAQRNALNETVMVKGIPYRIIGVMKEKDQDSSYDGQDVNKLFGPITAVLRDLPEAPPSKATDIDRLLVTPRTLEQHEACKAEMRRALGRIHKFDPLDEEAAGVWDTVENQKAFRKMTDGMKYFLGAVGVVTLLLGGLGVMNVMLVAVRERTREIGVRKAVGATSGSVLRQFFLETMFVALLSGAVGLGVAYGICALVNSFPMPQFFDGLRPTWGSSLLSFGLLGLIAILSGMYPASRAAAVDPIEALRHEAGG
jgi:putative ABC transport system permease protein